MKTIIAATDFSPLAEHAAEYAAAIAGHIQARLALFNAFHVPVDAANGLLSSEDYDHFLHDNQHRLLLKGRQLARRYHIRVDYETTYSEVSEDLEQLLTKYKATLLVMGMEPESTWQRFFGNTTTAVIKRLDCPVLSVPSDTQFDGFKNILFACDAAHELPLAVLRQLKTLARDFGAAVEVFFVNEGGAPRPDAEAIIARELEGIFYRYQTVASPSVIPAIRQEIDRSKAELLVMAPKTYGFWSSVTHQSKTRRMAAGLTIPLLALPCPEQSVCPEPLAETRVMPAYTGPLKGNAVLRKDAADAHCFKQ